MENVYVILPEFSTDMRDAFGYTPSNGSVLAFPDKKTANDCRLAFSHPLHYRLVECEFAPRVARSVDLSALHPVGGHGRCRHVDR